MQYIKNKKSEVCRAKNLFPEDVRKVEAKIAKTKV